MAPPPELWQDYFDDPTLSDLAIRLSDRVVHVHRIVLCRGSEYFAKLLTSSFMESQAKEIDLHEDDPIAAVEILRYNYGLDYDKSHMDAVGKRQFIAALFVTAAEYQLSGLENKTYEDMRKIVTAKKLSTQDSDQVDDFLNAVGTVVAGSTRHDSQMRKLMVDYCFWNLPALVDKLSHLLMDNGDLGAEIITRFRPELSLFEGSWYWKGEWHPFAKPSCLVCDEPFSKQDMLLNLAEEFWTCSNCEEDSHPVCTEDCCIHLDYTVELTWVWEGSLHND